MQAESSKAECSYPPNLSNPIRNVQKYELKKENPSRVLIFNQRKFADPKLKERIGSIDDVELFADSLDGYFVKIKIYHDLDFANIIRTIKDETTWSPVGDCLLIYIATHGGKDDYLWAYDQKFHVNQLKEILSCSSLHKYANIPKHLWIFACRGDAKDKVFPFTQSMGISDRSDLCVFWSTVPGFKSFRSLYKPSPVIGNVTTKLKLNTNLSKDKQKSLVEMLILTTEDMKYGLNVKKTSRCITEITSTLVGPNYLPTKE